MFLNGATALRKMVLSIIMFSITMHDAMFARNLKEVHEIFKHKK
jgi:hypothetical protein